MDSIKLIGDFLYSDWACVRLDCIVSYEWIIQSENEKYTICLRTIDGKDVHFIYGKSREDIKKKYKEFTDKFHELTKNKPETTIRLKPISI